MLIYGLLYMAPTDKKSAVCFIQKLKTKHSYKVTCNPCKVELDTTTTSKL
jgi:hypothetical protein